MVTKNSLIHCCWETSVFRCFRCRVTTHKVWQKWTGSEEPDYIVYYDYDLMGRVKREIHEIPMLKRFKHHKFEMMYLYDAISGKVRQMIYNKGKKDEFRHRFAYDAMGNLKYVWTSRDGKRWTLESALKYYPDGKLMRREIRPKDLMLQGLDYAYTLDGWLKAINSEVVSNDPSKDGISGTYQYFARDVFSLLLRYYPNDYKPIKPTATPLEASINSGVQHLYKPYYTGWISSWSLHLDTLHTAYSFRYDRLGRLTRATTLTGFNGTEWSASLIKNYSTKYSYDLVGNILSLTRYGSDTNAIDVLTYEYYNRSRNNRLKRIVDGAGRMIGIDLETQPIDNYGYDPVGNMVKDSSRNMRVFYTYSNKPKQIQIGNGMIKMFYNPFGYRFFKGSGSGNEEIFIYNSQGQLIAKYSTQGNKLSLDFMPIYEGTKRLGIIELEGVEWYAKRKCYVKNPLTGEEIEVPCGGEFDVGDAPMLRAMPRGESRVLKPSRKYELTDHLNNVRVVIRDQRVPVPNNGNTVAYYKPLVHEISDYYPYGWQKILGRYQFGANAGSLFEDWDSTRGTYYTLYRLLDARIARWYQVEPLWERYAWMSPYVVNSGNPVIFIDILGDRPKVEVQEKDGVVNINVKFKLYVYGEPVDKGYRFSEEFMSELKRMYPNLSGLKVGDKTVNINFEIEVEYVKDWKEAKKKIKESGYGVGVELIDSEGRSGYDRRGFINWRLSNIKLYMRYSKEQAEKVREAGLTVEQAKARELAHELGHDLGFLDRYVDVEYKGEPKSFPIVPFQFTLMGSLSPFSEIEGKIMAADILYKKSLKKGQKLPSLDYRLAWKIKKPLKVKYIPFDVLRQRIIENEEIDVEWDPSVPSN